MSKRILITGARAPVALHLARSLAQAGHRIVLADSFRFPISRATRFKHGYYRLPAPADGIGAYGTAVETLVREEHCDLVLPTCEEVFFLAALRDLHGLSLPLVAPHFETLKAVHDKFVFSTLVQDYDLQAPGTVLLKNRADVEAMTSEAQNMVFKPVWSRFGNMVLIRPSPDQLADLNPSEAYPWIAQDYLPGDELCAWSFVQNGEIRAIASYRPLYRAGIGASVAFEPVEDAKINDFIARFAREQSWSGHLAFDFRRDGNGKLHVLECNPRATSGLHFFSPESALAEAVLNNAQAQPDVMQPMTLPLAMLVYGLPQAISQHGHAGFSKWRADLSRMHDISHWPGDRSLWLTQMLSLGEITARAITKRCGLTTAATSDIEWNGEDLSPVAL